MLLFRDFILNLYIRWRQVLEWTQAPDKRERMAGDFIGSASWEQSSPNTSGIDIPEWAENVKRKKSAFHGAGAALRTS